ncbi:MAG: hypothetical protein JWN44_291 [Myxococcales bacterium]|nr:hypothetical protein [Myxococcales bacterium]
MIEHVSIGVRNLGATKAFYDSALEALGYSFCVRAIRAGLWEESDRVFGPFEREPGAGGSDIGPACLLLRSKPEECRRRCVTGVGTARVQRARGRNDVVIP